MYLAYFDGSAKPNPGEMQSAYVIKDSVSGDVLYYGSKKLGYGTNNQAEYLALVGLVNKILELKLENIKICGDSELIVNQVTGRYKVNKTPLKEMCEYIKKTIKQIKGCSIEHVMRENNKDADRLTR